MKKRKAKNRTALGLCLLMSFLLLAGCQPAEPEPPEEQEPPETMEAATLYFANDEYVETGDESLDRVIAVESEIAVGEDGNVLLIMLEALAEAPEEPEGLSTATAEVTFLDVYYQYPEEADYEEGSNEGTIYVDLSSEGLHGGSLTETLFIDQVVETLLANGAWYTTEAFSCDKVQFLVDGETAETLMGHYDATEPFGSQL